MRKKKRLFEYHVHVDFKAKDWKEAEKKLKKIKQTGFKCKMFAEYGK